MPGALPRHERFKTRAIQEHGSPRQAASFLFRQFIGINQPDTPGPKEATMHPTTTASCRDNENGSA
jgi:hypothetical protein